MVRVLVLVVVLVLASMCSFGAFLLHSKMAELDQAVARIALIDKARKALQDDVTVLTSRNRDLKDRLAAYESGVGKMLRDSRDPAASDSTPNPQSSEAISPAGEMPANPSQSSDTAKEPMKAEPAGTNPVFDTGSTPQISQSAGAEPGDKRDQHPSVTPMTPVMTQQQTGPSTETSGEADAVSHKPAPRAGFFPNLVGRVKTLVAPIIGTSTDKEADKTPDETSSSKTGTHTVIMPIPQK